MTNAIIGLWLVLTPLLPEQLPANTIYMGEHIQPIVASRSKCKSLTGFCMTLTLKNFLQVKDAVQNQPSLCSLAVKETADTCRDQAESLADLVSSRKLKDQEIIDSYKIKLKAVEFERDRANSKRLTWKYVSAGLVGLSAILTTTVIVMRN